MVAVRSLFSYICVVFCACSLLLVAGEISFATNSIAYHGRIIKPNGSAFEPSSATLVLQIRSTGTEDCLMWEETFSNVDMTGTAGVFSLNLNSGTGSRTDGSGLTFAQVFGNYPTTTMTVPLANCAGGSNTITLTANSHRIARLRFKDSVMPSFEQTPDMAIAYVPFSMDSQKVGGFTPQNLLRVEDATGPQAAAAFSPADFLELQALIGGSSGQYEKAGELNGQAIPALSNNNVLAWNGGGWTAVTPVTTETDPNTRSFAKADLPTCNPGEFLSSTGANTWVCAGVSGAAGGTVTSITVGSGLVDGSNNTGTNILTTGTIALPDVVTAGTGTKVTYDVKGRITASTTLAETDLPNITTAGKVSGDAITSGTIAGSTAMNTSGNITAATGSLRTLVLRDADTNTVTVQTPADVTANYVLTLPPNDGGAGEVLTTDGSGVLSWTSMSGGSGATSVAASDGTAAAPSVSFSSDPDTGWFRPAADTLAAATAGAERVRINSVGNVGIGTTNPTSQLHITNNDGITRSPVMVDLDNPVGNAVIKFPYGASILNGYDGMQLVTNGDHLIFGNDEFRFSGSMYKFEPTGDVEFRSMASSGNKMIFASPGDLIFRTYNGLTGFDPRMTISQAGDVGIGTTTPDAMLTIQKNQSADTKIHLKNTDAGGNSIFQFYTDQGLLGELGGSGSSVSAPWGNRINLYSYPGADGINIFVEGADPITFFTTYTERMIIDPNGLVGIGTNSPGRKLDVFGSGRFKSDGGLGLLSISAHSDTPSYGSYINLTRTRGTFASPTRPLAFDNIGALQFANYDETRAPAGIYANTSEDHSATAEGSMLTFTTTANTTIVPTERMRIDHNGNVGIGTADPGMKLDVDGDIRIATASKLYVGATATCDSTGCTAAPSDIRYKENVTPLRDSLDNILKIQGVSYDWIDKQAFNDKHQIGFIAQDLEKIYPEVVKTDEKTGFKSVMYDKLVAPLIEAFKVIYSRLQVVESDLASVKEQKADKAETEVLKVDNAAKDKKIQKLEQDNAEMKARLDKIEQMLKSK